MALYLRAMAIDTTYEGPRLWVELTAAAGDAETWTIPFGYDDIAFTVHPGAGGTASLATTCAARAAVEAGTAPFVPIALGGADAVSEAAGAALPAAVTAVRLTATTAAARARLALRVRA